VENIVDMLYNEHDEHLARIKRFDSLLVSKDFEKIKLATDELNFELDVHFKEEEEALFPRFFEIYTEFPPVDCMLSEHKEMREMLNKLSNIELSASNFDEFEKIYRLLKDTVLAHIEKENNILFNMAKNFIPLDKLENALSSAKDVREKLLA
jgi:hemerythrin-like domain-containing protein